MNKPGFEILLKNGKPYLRMKFVDNTHIDMFIFKAKSEQPYVKFMSGFTGITYLDEDCKAELAKIL